MQIGPSVLDESDFVIRGCQLTERSPGKTYRFSEYAKRKPLRWDVSLVSAICIMSDRFIRPCEYIYGYIAGQLLGSGMFDEYQKDSLFMRVLGSESNR